jgi:hypothetical protein
VIALPLAFGHSAAGDQPAPGGRGARESASQLTVDGIGALVAELRRRGYRVIAPVRRDGALVLDEVRDAGELPWGLGVESGPGHYRLVERGDGQLFAGAAGPMPWKRFLRPPREKILDADRSPPRTAGSTAPHCSARWRARCGRRSAE